MFVYRISAYTQTFLEFRFYEVPDFQLAYDSPSLFSRPFNRPLDP